MERTYDEMLAEYLENKPSSLLEFYFLYYENAGELVSKFKYEPKVIFNQESGVWEGIPEGTDHSIYEDYDPMAFPLLFNQDGIIIRPIRYNVSSETNFLEAKTMWLDNINYTPFVRVIHIDNRDGTTTLANPYGISLFGVQEVYFGEFFMLSNNYKVIKRFNIKTELLQEDKNSTVYTDLNPGFSYPPDTRMGKDLSFTRWYFGYSPIPEEQRPDFLSMPEVTPTINKFIHTESRRRWQSLREECLSWHRVYDKYNMNYEAKNLNSRPESIIGTMKCALDFNKLKDFLDESFNYDSYETGSKIYDIILYPPSMYKYPADSVITILEPRINSVNDFTDRIIFEAPSMFKTDGNFHYNIDFYEHDNKETLLFSTSSFSGDDYYESSGWFHSIDGMETWEPIGALQPTFDNRYEDEHGTDAIQTTHIKYVLSQGIFNTVRSKPSISFTINQIDGTLVHFYARKFQLSYNNELT